jgi:hypothetical protein
MLQAILVWSGAVLGLVVLLMVALGPVIVEVDSWWYERQHNRRRRAHSAAAAEATGSVRHGAAQPAERPVLGDPHGVRRGADGLGGLLGGHAEDDAHDQDLALTGEQRAQ